MFNDLESYRSLIQDTLQLLKEDPTQTFLIGSPEETVFFRQTASRPTSISPTPPKTSSPTPLIVASKVIEKPSTAEIAPIKKVSEAVPVIKEEPPALPSKIPPKNILEAKMRSGDDVGGAAIKKALQMIAPYMRLSDEIPDDAEAKRIRSAWKEKIPEAEIILLALDSSPETIEFLKNLAKAIHKELAPAKVVSPRRLESEKKWDLFLEKNNFRLIIATQGLEQFSELMTFYKALPAQSQTFLGKTPLLMLSSVSSYLQSPQQKAILWKNLCQMIKK